MKKVIAWLLVLALTATVSIGATLAYLTDTDEDVNVMTLGKVKIDQLEYERIDDESKNDDAEVQEFHDNKPLYPAVTEKGFDYTPGDPYVDWEQIGKDGYTSEIWDPDKINNEIDKMVFVKNKGDYDAYVRSVIAFEAVPGWTFDDFESMIHLNVNTNEDVIAWEWIETPVSIGEGTYFVAVATYKEALKPGELTEISLSQIALDSSATNEDMEALGDTYNVLVKSQAIQADGFADAETALNKGFGEITATSIPFTTDQPIKGIDVRSALRFYKGDATQPIHTEVTNVVFGLNKDYPEIVANYDGTLVTEEQDVDVYSYYVQDDGKYTVYFLANGEVFLPKDSSQLFREMSKLTTVETYNLNTSRAVLMNQLFNKCYKLWDIDVSGFDTGNVTTMRSMFNDCNSLESVDVSDWNTSKVTDMAYMFRYCKALKEVDLSSFDVSDVTDMTYMFLTCENLQTVDTTGWDTTAVTSTKAMFMNCYKLENLPGIESWDTPNNTTLYYMFQGCALKTINVSGWDTANVTNMQGVFYECNNLTKVEGAQNWDTGKATTMAAMFSFCNSLESLDVSTWKTGNVETMYGMFFDCANLKSLDVSNWDTGEVTNFQSMFSDDSNNTGAMQITDLDISNWDVSSATTMAWMFYGCGQLTELDMSKWDVSNVTTMFHMFADCFKMTDYNFTGWNTESLVTINGIFNSNRALKTIDVSAFDTAGVTDFAQTFDGCTSLEEIIGLDQWDTSSGQNFGEFLLDTNVREIDLSSFDMSSANNVTNMFHVNSQLTTIYVGDNWNLNPEQLNDVNGMFGSSGALVGGNGSTVASLGSNSAIYARVDTEETPGLLTHINDKPVTNP